MIDRAILASSRAIEGPALLNRRFYPEIATRSFPWPAWNSRSSSWRLWLGEDELISASSVVSGGQTIAATDYFLEPANSGPPFDSLEIDLSSSATFSVGDTHQRNIVIAGTFGGCPEVTEALGTLTEALDAVETDVDVSDSSVVGVGSIIKVDSERMMVTRTGMLASGQNTGGALAENKGVVAVPVTDGTLFFVDEVILVDSERMLIVDISGNTLHVRRAFDGTSLAAHNTNTGIYVPRRLTVERAALGTTVATHDTAAPVLLQAIPPLVEDLCEAETLTRLLNKQAGYSRTAGSGDNARELRGVALHDVRCQAIAAHGRRDFYRGAI